MGVSKNNGIPKSSTLIGFSIINHPFWGTLIFGNTHMGILHANKNMVKQVGSGRKINNSDGCQVIEPC